MIVFRGLLHGTIAISILIGLKVDFNIYLFLGAWIGSYLPDCDIKGAPASFWIPLYKFFKHRKETHSLFFGMCFSSIFIIFNLNLGIGILIGYLLHLFFDATTPMQRTQPMPILYPFKR